MHGEKEVSQEAQTYRGCDFPTHRFPQPPVRVSLGPPLVQIFVHEVEILKLVVVWCEGRVEPQPSTRKRRGTPRLIRLPTQVECRVELTRPHVLVEGSDKGAFVGLRVASPRDGVRIELLEATSDARLTASSASRRAPAAEPPARRSASGSSSSTKPRGATAPVRLICLSLFLV